MSQPRRDPIDVLLFVSLFPRSIAGPIVRLREIEDQLHEACGRVPEQVSEGAIRFVHGLAKKVLIADQIAPIADAAFAQLPTATSRRAAPGSARSPSRCRSTSTSPATATWRSASRSMLGFRLPENFDRPYTSRSVTEFWRRWHMTLSRWFRDYVYIPLGGSRAEPCATYRNLIVVFALVGLWHGAAWTFVLWGLYHGMWLLAERRFGLRALGEDVRAAWLRRALTFLIVLFGWVLFRAGSRRRRVALLPRDVRADRRVAPSRSMAR